MGAPRLAPGTKFGLRGSPDDPEGRTEVDGRPRSKFHTLKRWWRGHHLERSNDGEFETTNEWARGKKSPAKAAARPQGASRQQLRDDIKLGKHAQDLRAEAATHGGREETQSFYGRGRENVGHGTEQRLTAAKYEKQLADHEAAEAEKYGGRRRRGPSHKMWEGFG